MNDFYFILAALLPALISGLLPVLAWQRLGPGQGRRWQPLVAILLATALNLAAAVFVLANLDGFLPPGFFAIILMVVCVPATLLLALALARRTNVAAPDEAGQRRWLRLGVYALPLLQLLTAATLFLVAPALCGMGLRSCGGF